MFVYILQMCVYLVCELLCCCLSDATAAPSHQHHLYTQKSTIHQGPSLLCVAVSSDSRPASSDVSWASSSRRRLLALTALTPLTYHTHTQPSHSQPQTHTHARNTLCVAAIVTFCGVQWGAMPFVVMCPSSI